MNTCPDTTETFTAWPRNGGVGGALAGVVNVWSGPVGPGAVVAIRRTW